MMLELRQRFMSTRRVVCTGNPDAPGTLASGFRKIFPHAVFLCRSTGWDLANLTEQKIQQLRGLFGQGNTFLNCSYIAPGIQTYLLDICAQSCKFCDVVNIGSTHEYDGLGLDSYSESKRQLRDRSLQLGNFRFYTSHLVLGGIKNSDDFTKANWIEIDDICQTVLWIWNQKYRIPLMSLDQQKQPW